MWYGDVYGVRKKKRSAIIYWLTIIAKITILLWIATIANAKPSILLNRIDFNVDPCDNFYQFVCGGFFKSGRRHVDKKSMHELAEEQLIGQLKNMMEAKIKPNEPKPFKLVKTLYKSCMDQANIEARGLKPLREILDKNGGWPVLDGNSWTEKDFDWKNLIYKFRNAGLSVNYYHRFDVKADIKNNTRRVITLAPAVLGLHHRFLTNGFENNMVQTYYTYMVDTAVLMGARRDYAMVELKKSLMFEIELAKISAREQRDRNKLLNSVITLKKLTEIYPILPWKDHFTKILSLPAVNVNDETLVTLKKPSYMQKLVDLISITPKRVQANYAMWRVTADSAQFLNDEIRKIELAFTTATSSHEKLLSRWKECIYAVRDNLGLSVSAMYVRKYFNPETKKKVSEIMTSVYQQFKKYLEEVSWLDDATRKAASEKASAMTISVAHRDELMNDKKLADYYRNLEFSEENYLENMLNINRFKTNYKFGELNKPALRNDWTRYEESAIVNAAYSPIYNSVEISAGNLQDYFFNADRPKYMNYGSIGAIIGHEIGHGFDNNGRKFDKFGNLKEWWTPRSKGRFTERAACIVSQYGNYTAREVGLNVNGVTTLGENIADNIGTKIAYLAYTNWADRNVQEGELPGLDYTPRQMFWISLANTWCTKDSPDFLRELILSDPHTPNEFRIVGPLSNMNEFLNDFKCSTHSNMNRQEKCCVW